MKKFRILFIFLIAFCFNTFSQTGTIKVVKPIDDSLEMTGNWFINKTREVIEAWNKDKITQSKDLIKINSDKTYTCTNKIFADGKWEINEGKMILYPSNYTNGKYVLSILDKKQESVTLFLSNKNNAVDVEYYFYLTK